MKSHAIVAVLAVCAACLVASAFGLARAQGLALGSNITGRAYALDGDTLILNSASIRLWGIDAPERRADEACSSGRGQVSPTEFSTARLAELIGDNDVSCEIRGYDSRWRRSVALCRVNGEDVASAMVSRGFARDWPRYSGGHYARQEAEARNSRAGFWGMTCPNLWGDRDYNR